MMQGLLGFHLPATSQVTAVATGNKLLAAQPFAVHNKGCSTFFCSSKSTRTWYDFENFLSTCGNSTG
jgi:hypothetical protein